MTVVRVLQWLPVLQLSLGSGRAEGEDLNNSLQLLPAVHCAPLHVRPRRVPIGGSQATSSPFPASDRKSGAQLKASHAPGHRRPHAGSARSRLTPAQKPSPREAPLSARMRGDSGKRSMLDCLGQQLDRPDSLGALKFNGHATPPSKYRCEGNARRSLALRSFPNIGRPMGSAGTPEAWSQLGVSLNQPSVLRTRYFDTSPTSGAKRRIVLHRLLTNGRPGSSKLLRGIYRAGLTNI